MQLVASAKINLTLDVLGRRTDGYHELRSVMQTVSLADDVHVELATDLSLVIDPPFLAGPSNLVWRAAEELRRHTGYVGGASFYVRKKVPVAAGLGGGSSDAAAALIGLNTLWGLDLSLEELAGVAAAVGSDVPFFLWGGTALISGRGEFVQPLPALPPLPLVLAKPPIGVSTARIFAALSPDHYTNGAASSALLSAAFTKRPETWFLHNALQETVCRLYPEVTATLQALEATGACSVLMSGSGPTCFGIFATHADASAAARQLSGQFLEVWAVTNVPHPTHPPAEI